MTEHTLVTALAALIFWAFSNPLVALFVFLVALFVFVLFVHDFVGCMQDHGRR